jgi:GNAT superfamily N-acetyltransferase
VIDLDQGWRTERLDLEPLSTAADGSAAGPAEVAWVLGRQARGRGYAKEAASGLVALLREAGWTVIAHIHPAHLASQRVACAAGLSPTGEVHDGEVRWVIRPAGEAEQATFVIRAAVPGDISALRDVFRRSSRSNDGDRANLLAHPEVLEFSDLAVREGRTQAAVADDRIVGFASWLGTGNIFEIEDLFVDPARMRQGIGRALVLDLIAIARGQGIRRVEVTANQHALAFYEKTGFVVDREVTTMFGPAPRMHMELAPMGGSAGPVRLR